MNKIDPELFFEDRRKGDRRQVAHAYDGDTDHAERRVNDRRSHICSHKPWWLSRSVLDRRNRD
ncbi:MAG: hypothetical protein MI976_23700 [Pseudomonadales bacterium]|nr:hypothetical protein [Pseudomonadales bacterium]